MVTAAGRRRPPVTIVFLHGYLGLLPKTLYWRPMRPLLRELEAAGHRVRVPAVSPIHGVEPRARRAWRSAERPRDGGVVLVGHSMGGLDARFIAARLDPGRRVRAVVTLGTPHHGSPLADPGYAATPRLARLLRAIDRGALRDLGTAALAAFNRATPDRDDVLYLALAGARPATTMAVPLLRKTALYLERTSGPNDGQVPLASQRWGERTVEVTADHFELVGWRPFRTAKGVPVYDHIPPLRRLIAAALDA